MVVMKANKVILPAVAANKEMPHSKLIKPCAALIYFIRLNTSSISSTRTISTEP